MPFDKTGLRVTRNTKSGGFNGEILNVTKTIVFEGQREVEFTGSLNYNTKQDEMFQQKQVCLVYFLKEDGIKNGDEIEFNLSQLGQNTNYIPEQSDKITLQAEIPIHHAMRIGGKLYVETYGRTRN